MFDRTEDVIRCLSSIENELHGLRSETQSFLWEFQRERSNAEFRFALGIILFICLLVIVSAAGAGLRDSVARVAHLCANTQANQISDGPPRP
jgi:hypothetical protein